MNKFIFLSFIFCLFFSTQVEAQKKSNTVFNATVKKNPFGIPLETEEECKKAEPKILEVAKNSLTQPITELVPGSEPVAFVMIWALNTEYSIVTTPKITKLAKKQNSINYLYFAFSAVYIIENSETNPDKVAAISIKNLAEYILNPKNNVIMTRHIKKFIKSYKNGTIEKYIF
jgi:hypothetical protein